MQEELGGTPKGADVSLREAHGPTHGSNSQSSLSSIGSKMLQSTKLTLLDLIHQYKSTRQSSDASAAQHRKVCAACHIQLAACKLSPEWSEALDLQAQGSQEKRRLSVSHCQPMDECHQLNVYT